MANMASSELNGDRNLFLNVCCCVQVEPVLIFFFFFDLLLHTFDQLVFTSPSEAVVDMSSRS